MKSGTWSLVVAVAVLVMGRASGGAAAIRVAPDGTGDFTAIQPAIDAAVDGDAVVVAAGEYIVAEPVDFGGKAIALRAEAGAVETTIRMSETPSDPKRASVVMFAAGESEAASLEGFTLTGGRGTFTDAPQCEGGPDAFDCVGGEAWVGGGLFCERGARPSIINCRITGNVSDKGAGVFCRSSASFLNCVIAGNLAREQVGDAIYCPDPPWPSLRSCTIGGRRYATAPLYARPSADNCLLWGSEGNVRVGRSNMHVDPAMELVDAAGGDYRPRPGSIAIDAGTSEGAPSFDLDGHVRPCGRWVDVGAYEAGDCGPQPRFRRGDASADGKANLTDAILTLSHLLLGGEDLPCDKAADADDTKGLTLGDAVYLLEFFFRDGAPPPPPFPECGWDPTVDVLDCRSYPGCR